MRSRWAWQVISGRQRFPSSARAPDRLLSIHASLVQKKEEAEPDHHTRTQHPGLRAAGGEALLLVVEPAAVVGGDDFLAAEHTQEFAVVFRVDDGEFVDVE